MKGETRTCVLTLRMDEASQKIFEQLRQRYFPPERNVIAAHLTMFHTLPEDDGVTPELEQAAIRQAPFPMEVEGLRSLGRGVAYTIRSAELLRLHRELSSVFAEHLSAQDRQRFQPHVVVQNKVDPRLARELLAELRAGFAPWEARALGLDLWRYMGGPWEFVRTFGFGR